MNVVSNHILKVSLYTGLTIGLPLGLNVLMAALSFRYFVTPFLKMKKRHSVIESDPSEKCTFPSK